MIRVDMSEYMEKHSTSRLVGSPPGYVGYDEGKLTEKVRRKPYSVVLLDEIEKAHPDVFNILLQVLEDGRLTDSKGRTVDFRNTILIMTSNVGASELKRNKYVGFNVQDESQNHKDMKDKVMGELKRAFSTSLSTGLTKLSSSTPLRKHLTDIVSLMSDQLTKRLKEQDLYRADGCCKSKSSRRGRRFGIRRTSVKKSDSKACGGPVIRRTPQRQY